MKKSLIFLLIAIIFSFGASNSFAKTSTSSAGITFQDLGMENPGILPTSPFYFLKNTTRGIQRFFTFNPVKKAKLELEISNQQIAEIKKMKEISPERTDVITKAAENYQNNIERLKVQLETIKETSENPNVNELVDNLVDRSIKHQQLFEELKKDFQDNTDLKAALDKNQESISETVAKVPEKFESAKQFKERLKKNIENQFENEIGELKAIGIIDKFESKLLEDDKDEMESIKDDFVKKFEERMEKLNKIEKEKILNSEALENLSNDPVRREKIFGDIKGRFESSDLEEKFGEAEKKILEKNIESEDFDGQNIEKMINNVGDSLDDDRKQNDGLENELLELE
ncbi:hypothetical protein HZB04_00780 [Candidatus Wolfebacteria bacterium]|nr:hypothetical protein [Candidatus Wolfebacteria bacterium]